MNFGDETVTLRIPNRTQNADIITNQNQIAPPSNDDSRLNTINESDAVVNSSMPSSKASVDKVNLEDTEAGSEVEKGELAISNFKASSANLDAKSASSTVSSDEFEPYNNRRYDQGSPYRRTVHDYGLKHILVTK